MENEKIETNAENNVNQQNSNSEVKPRNKKVTIVLVSVIVVLLIAIGVCAGLWFAGDTTKIINNKEEVVKEEEKNTSKKIDETKPWVYDAEYNKDKENKIVDDYYNFNKDVKVPYININSKDAEKVNNEIKNIYEEVYSKFGSTESYTYNGVISDFQITYRAEYEYYENDNILSIVLKISDMPVNGGGGASELYTYNFNLDTLNIATFEEMAKLCGFSSASEVTDKITKWETAQNDFVNSNPDKVAAQMMGVVDGQYFIDANRKLNFVYVSAAAGNYYTPTTVEPNKEIENFYDMSNVDEPQVQKSIFSEADALNYTSNPKDNINGKIAVLKIGEKAFQTVMHDGYYTYTDNFSNSYNIKKITDITSEYRMTGNDNWANLFKCTVKYLDNNNANKSFDIAVIVPTTSNEAYFMAPYDNYTGTTSFVKGFTDLYAYENIYSVSDEDYEYLKQTTERVYELLELKKESPEKMLAELNLTVQSIEESGENYIQHPDGYTWTGIKYVDFKSAVWYINEELLVTEDFFPEFKEYNGYLYITPYQTKDIYYELEFSDFNYDVDSDNTAYVQVWVKESTDVDYNGTLVTLVYERGNGDFVLFGIGLG